MQENELVIDKASGELVKFKDSTQAFEDSIVKMNGVVKKDFKDNGDAIKELSGGIIDLNQYFGNGMDKVNANMTLVTTPFKALNSVIVSTSSFFGKEFNPKPDNVRLVARNRRRNEEMVRTVLLVSKVFLVLVLISL